MNEEQKQKMREGRKARKTRSQRVVTADRGYITLSPYTKNDAIKVFCTECLGFETNPKDCTAPNCPLYCYRGRTLRTQKGDGGGRTE